MVVVTLSRCPPKLRGDLSKWLMEISTGVYVGNLNAKVRDELWDRICNNLQTGQATMVFSTNGEQHMDFRVHNTSWEPVDYEGLKLIRHSSVEKQIEKSAAELKHGYSKAAKYYQAKVSRKRKAISSDYVVFSLETANTETEEDEIIEIGALKIRDAEVVDELSVSVNNENLERALRKFLDFVGTDTILCHDARYNCLLFMRACAKCQLKMFTNRCVDSLSMAKRRLPMLDEYSIRIIANHYNIYASCSCRTLEKCYLTKGIYEKLKET